jgi:predicted Zn-dependent protease with MMP-like domain
MRASIQQFDQWVREEADKLPEKFVTPLFNVALLVEDEPSEDQKKKTGLRKDSILLGLFEGYVQSKNTNVGPVLPDRITLFRKAILSVSSSEKDVKAQIMNTLKHEIAHHLGFDEKGARKVSIIE